MPFIREQDEESKREFLQIISSSSIADPDLIPLSCKSLPNPDGNLIQDLKCLDADLVRDHHHHNRHPHAAQNLLTHSSIQFIQSPAAGDHVSDSGRMDSITERTMTTDSNMTSISESMSPFIEVNGSAMDLLHESVDASAGILILPVSSNASSDLLIPRTSYPMSPAGSIGFNRHSDVRFMKSLMASRSSSHPFAGDGEEEHQQQQLHQENPHQMLHHGMQVHQMQHHQPAEHQFKQHEQQQHQQGHAAYYYGEDGNAQCDQGLGSQLSHLCTREGGESHLWHHSTASTAVSTFTSLMSQTAEKKDEKKKETERKKKEKERRKEFRRSFYSLIPQPV
jgi:hypothetical protein